MGRLVDADTLKDKMIKYGFHAIDMTVTEFVEDMLPTVEAIPIAEVKKFLEEGTKNVGNNVLAIVREDYIHKADYETRLKAEKVAMLAELKAEIEEMQCLYVDFVHYVNEYDVSNLIQQKINSLKENKDGNK